MRKNESLYFKYFKIKENFSFSKLKCKLWTFFYSKTLYFPNNLVYYLGHWSVLGTFQQSESSVPYILRQIISKKTQSFSYVRHFIKKYSSLHLIKKNYILSAVFCLLLVTFSVRNGPYKVMWSWIYRLFRVSLLQGSIILLLPPPQGGGKEIKNQKSGERIQNL